MVSKFPRWVSHWNEWDSTVLLFQIEKQKNCFNDRPLL